MTYPQRNEEKFSLCPLQTDRNVTFEPENRDHWHIYLTGQILLVTGGCVWYQEEGKAARPLTAGDVVGIPVGVKHWHGAAKDSWFSYLAIKPDMAVGLSIVRTLFFKVTQFRILAP